MTRPNRGRQWRTLRARILRDNDTCWICGQPGADSIDHVIPVAVAPELEYTPSNCRPAHMHPCNRAKSDKDNAPIIRRSGALD